MSKKRIVCIILAAVNLLFFSMICVMANPENVPANEVPVVSEPATSQVVPPESSEPVSVPTSAGGVVDPSASVDPSATGEPVTEPSSDIYVTSEITSQVPSTPRPTEFLENPSQDFDIQTPQLVRPDDNKDNSAKDWENIDEKELLGDSNDKLSLKDDGDGDGGFGFDKNSASLTDEKDPTLAWITFGCWLIALGLLTLAIFLRPSQKVSAKKLPASDENKVQKNSKGARYSKKK